jgi:HAD domain in Swiss Army Knife RNA repair proteins
MESDYIPAEGSVQLLNALIQQTGAKIVVSSCWRKRRTCVELQELLSGWGVEGVVLDKTPTFPEDARGPEIQQWLAERKKSTGDVESFVILDDCSEMPDCLSFWFKLNLRLD